MESELTEAGVELQAPAGKFRVVGVDTFSHKDWVQGDFGTFKEAKDTADKKGGDRTMMHVYDDQGNHRHSAGWAL